MTSDLHIGHRHIAGIRGFASVDEHDEHLAAKWRVAVKPGDQIWALGDTVAGAPTRALVILAQSRDVRVLVVLDGCLHRRPMG
jgi:calcineurin-like phosphoesterase family protein